MRWIRNINFFVIGCCLFIFISCSSNVSNHDYSKQNVKLPENEIVVDSLCMLLMKPDSFNNKTVTLKTTLSKVGSITTFGDSQCEFRHDLVSVEFSSSYETYICNTNDDFSDELCLIAKATREKKKDINFQILASFTGKFESYESKEGFSLNGLRFLFVVKNIRNIEKISPIRSEKLR